MLKRNMIQLYFAHGTGDCAGAMNLYQEAFGGKKLNEHRAIENDPHHECGDIIHAEMDIFGQIFAFSEVVHTAEELVRGNGVGFWFQFEEGQMDMGRKAFNVLKEGAKETPQFNTNADGGYWNEWCFCITDRYGIMWGLFC